MKSMLNFTELRKVISGSKRNNEWVKNKILRFYIIWFYKYSSMKMFLWASGLVERVISVLVKGMKWFSWATLKDSVWNGF